MNAIIKTVFRASADFILSPVKLRIFLICVLILFALTDYLVLGLARRTFVFYNVSGGFIVVEDRMLKHSRGASTRARETDIIRYTEEMLLGPVSPELLPLFPRGTKLKSLMYRDRAVFVDFTESAALAPVEGGDVIVNFRTFYDGILRNFSYVNDVRFFIEGNSVLLEMTEEDDFSLSG